MGLFLSWSVWGLENDLVNVVGQSSEELRHSLGVLVKVQLAESAGDRSDRLSSFHPHEEGYEMGVTDAVGLQSDGRSFHWSVCEIAE